MAIWHAYWAEAPNRDASARAAGDTDEDAPAPARRRALHADDADRIAAAPPPADIVAAARRGAWRDALALLERALADPRAAGGAAGAGGRGRRAPHPLAGAFSV